MTGDLPRLSDLSVVGKRVLVRVDFNVPLAGEPPSCVVSDDFRIRAALPTLRWLIEHGATVTACSHLGRPNDTVDARFEMAPVRERLAELVPGVALGENLRFFPGERANDPAFVDALVEGQDAYVNEAFGVSHRAHASIVGPPARLPSAAGLQLEREVEVLTHLLDEAARPFVVIVGGAKVRDKIGVLRSLAKRADVLCVGGAMAFTFLKAAGHEVGASMVDETQLEECTELLRSGVRIVLPSDAWALPQGSPVGPVATSEAPGPEGGSEDPARDPATRPAPQLFEGELPMPWCGLDVGPKTAAELAGIVGTARTVLWNGPLGVAEDPRFAGGTHEVARAVASSSGFSVVGGGDSVAAIRHLGLAEEIGFLSTGGGATLAFLEHGDLPGLAALRDARRRSERG